MEIVFSSLSYILLLLMSLFSKERHLVCSDFRWSILCLYPERSSCPRYPLANSSGGAFTVSPLFLDLHSVTQCRDNLVLQLCIAIVNIGSGLILV